MSTATTTETEIQPQYEIPKTHKAAVYDKPGFLSTKVVELPTPQPGKGQVLVRLSHSGVCHSDLSIMRAGWGLPPPPINQVGGHEGVGIIVSLGEGASESGVKLGDRVGIKWNAEMCGECRPCMAGFDGHCELKKFSGYYTPGTFAQYALAPANYVTPIPDGVDSADAAPMLCAGLTVYSALLKCNAKPGDWVIISGAGGGLGHLALQLGISMGFKIIGIDHPSKSALIKTYTPHFLPFTSPLLPALQTLTSNALATAILVCAGTNAAYASALSLLGFGGTLVCVGMPEGESKLIEGCKPGLLASMQLRVVGSSVGSQKEAREVLELCRRGEVRTKVRIERMEGLQGVFEGMERGEMEGRVVLDLS